ncbi:MAG: protein-L-isoaspartate O-methyltransferase family protein [Candidatus Kariarchaeaceae archaeon]|jgi:protein-L-isoaspartate(D-aspartate) O-methyltransferase
MSKDFEVPIEFVDQIFRRLKQVRLEISSRVEEAFFKVPREFFVLDGYRNQAYTDRPLPTMSGQTISAPHMYAMMMSIEAGDPKEGLKVLEIGAGSGYGAALLGYVVNPGSVISIERHKSLVKFAKSNIRKANIDNVEIIHGNGTKDVPDMQFDRIIVTAAGKSFPTIYYEKIKVGGKIVIPLSDMFGDQWVWVFKKNENGTLSKTRLMQVAFVPLVF